MKKNKSVIHLLLFNEEAEDDVKCKNIKQTEILVDLREAILQVKHLNFTNNKLSIEFFFVLDSKAFFTSRPKTRNLPRRRLFYGKPRFRSRKLH